MMYQFLTKMAKEYEMKEEVLRVDNQVWQGRYNALMDEYKRMKCFYLSEADRFRPDMTEEEE